MDEITRNLEAMLFAAGDPLTVETMREALSSALGELADDEVEKALDRLARDYPRDGERGLELAHLAGGWTFRTNPSCHASVSALFEIPDDATRLSPAAIEVLAVVAYLQPVSRAQIGDIRGVNSDSPIHTLMERELITEVGRSSSAGGAVLYGTTRRFEAMFGLAGLDELPDLEGFALDEGQKEELRRRLGLLTVAE